MYNVGIRWEELPQEYKTSKDMSEELRKALPDIEDLKKLLDREE